MQLVLWCVKENCAGLLCPHPSGIRDLLEGQEGDGSKQV